MPEGSHQRAADVKQRPQGGVHRNKEGHEDQGCYSMSVGTENRGMRGDTTVGIAKAYWLMNGIVTVSRPTAG